MSGLEAQVRQFFSEYERANAEFDVAKIAALYAEVFMFGGPQGVQAVRKEEFVKVLPKRKDFFRAAGLVSSTVESIETTVLDSKYTLARVTWKMRFERNGENAVESLNFATYILSSTETGFHIILQLDHQDLKQVAQDR